MAEFNKNKKEESLTKEEGKVEQKVEVTREIKEVLVETKKDTSTTPTTFEERAKIEAEVTMIKVGLDMAGNWLFKRSDRLTKEDKDKRIILGECIRNGASKKDISIKFREKGLF